MVELIRELWPEVISEDGRRYVARVYGAPQPRGRTWDGWLVFFPVDGGPPLAGDRETSQSNTEELAYWAGGLEPIYLEGALERAERAQAAGMVLRRLSAWGERAADLVEEEEIAYRVARERISAAYPSP